MIGYKEDVDGVQYVFMNIDGSVLLEKCIHTDKDSGRLDYTKSWFRPVQGHSPNWRRRDVSGEPDWRRIDASDEPELPNGLSQRAVEHFRRQVRMKRWENR